MKTYKVYKLTEKYRKHPEMLTAFGFNKYVECFDNEEVEGGEKFYALPIRLSQDSPVVEYLIKAMEKIYSKATPEERKKDFSDYTFVKHFVKNEKTGKKRATYTLITTEALINEFSECQLCIACSGLGANTLFINAPDRVEYYAVEVLQASIPDVCKELVAKKVVRVAKIKQYDNEEEANKHK